MKDDLDPIQGKISGILDSVLGTPGDIAVLVLIGLFLFLLYKQRFKMATGFLVLMLGIVIIRVLISNLF